MTHPTAFREGAKIAKVAKIAKAGRRPSNTG